MTCRQLTQYFADYSKCTFDLYSTVAAVAMAILFVIVELVSLHSTEVNFKLINEL